VIRRTVSRFLELNAGRVFVVTVSRGNVLRDYFTTCPLILVHNPEYSGGMSTSVKAVLPLLDQTGGVFFHLGDKPLVQKETLGRMVEQYRKGEHRIVVPVYGGGRGHPC